LIPFMCSVCGTQLALSVASEVVSGPCPKCRTWIESFELTGSDEIGDQEASRTPNAMKGPRRRAQALPSGQGRIRAHGCLDHEGNERRELYSTLRVIAVALGMIAVIIFITLYLEQWMTR